MILLSRARSVIDIRLAAGMLLVKSEGMTLLTYHLALCEAGSESWLDPSPLSQMAGAIIGGVFSVLIALWVWRAEGRRIRQEIADEFAERRRSAYQLIEFDLLRLRKDVGKLSVIVDEVIVNVGRGAIRSFLSGTARINQNRVDSLFDTWLDTETLWVHMHPTLVRADIINAVGNVLAERDEVASELSSLNPKAFGLGEFWDRLGELQERLRGLDERIRYAIKNVQDTIATMGGAI